MSWARPGLGLVVRALRRFLDHDMSTNAAALAFRGLLALFPFVIFLFAVISVLRVDRLLNWLGDLARSGLPGQVPLPVKEWLIGQLRGRPGGAVLSVGALTASWTTANGIRMLRRALHTANGVPETRPVRRQGSRRPRVSPGSRRESCTVRSRRRRRAERRERPFTGIDLLPPASWPRLPEAREPACSNSE